MQDRYRFVKYIGWGDKVVVKGKLRDFKCIEMQCSKCPFNARQEVCLNSRVLDSIGDIFEKSHRTMIKNAKARHRVKYYLEQDIEITMPTNLYEGCDWKLCDYSDSYSYKINGERCCNRVKEDEGVDE